MTQSITSTFTVGALGRLDTFNNMAHNADGTITNITLDLDNTIEQGGPSTSKTLEM